MRVFVHDSKLSLPRPIEEVFAFFSDARNLETITPGWLRFAIRTPGPIEMRVGAVIDYGLRLHGIPFAWRSRITVWDPPRKFADEQLRGPYRLWRHEHRFEGGGDRTLVRDHVEYAVPGGWLVHKLFVAREVGRIFDYRRRVLGTIFAAPAG